MINKRSIANVDNSKFSTNFRAPLYNSYGFNKIPATINYLLTGKNEKKTLPLDVLGDLPKRYEKIILFFIDGFGWRFFKKHQNNYPFLKRIVKDGVVSKLTSQFPSTTTAQITTVHTGLEIGQHGVYEWFYYEPKLNRIIAPLPFSFAGDQDLDTLKKSNFDPNELFPNKNFYKDLKLHGVNSYIFQNKKYTPSSYSDVVYKKGVVFPYTNFSQAITNLTDLILKEKNKSYYFFYFDKIDSAGHQYGPDSKEFEAEIDKFLTIMEKVFYQNLFGKLKKTLFLMTADHGQVEVDPKTTIYLNLEFPEIKKYIKKNKNGDLLVPAGSCRDMFLHIKKESVNDVKDFLRKKLIGKAEVYKVEQLINKGFFGQNKPSNIFLNRVGDLVILPYKDQSVWWYEKGKFKQEFYGHHGGLTPEEMEIPLLVLLGSFNI